MKVVLLDDSPAVCEVIKDILEEAGFHVITLDNPFLLGAVVRREQPDVVLLDVLMPVVSGDHVAKIVRQSDQVAKVPFILYSDAPADTLATMVRECGAVGFIPKSVTKVELAQRIRDFAAARSDRSTKA